MNTEKLTAASADAVATLNTLATLQFNAIEGFANLSLKTVQSGISDSAKTLTTLSSIKDVKELSKSVSQTVEPNLAFTSAYLRNVYELASNYSTAVGEIFAHKLAVANKEVAAAITTLAANAPAESKAAFEAAKTMYAVSSKSIDGATKAAGEIVAATEKSITKLADAAISSMVKATA